MTKKYIYTVLLLVNLLVAGCSPGQLFGPTITPSRTSTLTQTSTLTPTFTLTPTSTATPTPTLTPTPILRGVVNESYLDVWDSPIRGSNIGRIKKGDEFTILGQFEDCERIKVTSLDSGLTGWIFINGLVLESDPNSEFSHVVVQVGECDSIPALTYRPSTGWLAGGIGFPGLIGGAWNRLRIYNYSKADCVFIVKPNEKDHNWDLYGYAVYIRAGENDETHMQSGSVDVYFTMGSEWNGYRFTSNAIFRHFIEPLVFRSTLGKYTVWTLTIAEGVGEAIVEIEESEFPDLRRLP